MSVMDLKTLKQLSHLYRQQTNVILNELSRENRTLEYTKVLEKDLMDLERKISMISLQLLMKE